MAVCTCGKLMIFRGRKKKEEVEKNNPSPPLPMSTYDKSKHGFPATRSSLRYRLEHILVCSNDGQCKPHSGTCLRVCLLQTISQPLEGCRMHAPWRFLFPFDTPVPRGGYKIDTLMLLPKKPTAPGSRSWSPHLRSQPTKPSGKPSSRSTARAITRPSPTDSGATTLWVEFFFPLLFFLLEQKRKKTSPPFSPFRTVKSHTHGNIRCDFHRVGAAEAK